MGSNDMKACHSFHFITMMFLTALSRLLTALSPKAISLFFTLFCFITPLFAKPLRLGIAGFTHDHVHQILRRPAKGDVEIVGVAEPNRELAMRYLKRYNLPESLWYASLDAMIAATKPEAVCAFNSIFEHKQVVEICAPKGIHVMVEKPLAVSVSHARKMQQLAIKHNILLLTNYETTWYASNHEVYKMVHHDKAIGALRKVVVHDGHKGPKEIGVNKEFLDWLTDPVLNGGGAITDFGCYGANLLTWLTNGQRPISVLALTQQFKPHLYPKVDDEATILLQYPSLQGIIQASWNWPFSRKDMEVYGETGMVIAADASHLRFRFEKDSALQQVVLVNRIPPYHDPFALFAALVNKEVTLVGYDLSSLENNLLVVEILEAAKTSARTGKAVKL